MRKASGGNAEARWEGPTAAGANASAFFHVNAGTPRTAGFSRGRASATGQALRCAFMAQRGLAVAGDPLGVGANAHQFLDQFVGPVGRELAPDFFGSRVIMRKNRLDQLPP